MEDWKNPKYKKDAKRYTAGVDKDTSALAAIALQPIGIVHSPYKERFATPRQPAYAVEEKPGSIILNQGFNFNQALQNVDTFSHVWVIYWMHLNQGWSPLVRPPRDKTQQYGLFSTRAPHRPNSIGLSVVPLLSVEGRTLNIGDHDMLDGTPVLDIKPYIPEADMMHNANHGWLDTLKNTKKL